MPGSFLTPRQVRSSRTRDRSSVPCVGRQIFHHWITMNYSPPGSSVRRISQAGILEWAATASSRGSADPEFESAAPALAGGFFTTEPPERM